MGLFIKVICRLNMALLISKVLVKKKALEPTEDNLDQADEWKEDVLAKLL